MTTDTRVDEALAAITEGDWDRLAGVLSHSFFAYEPGPDEPTAGDRLIGILTDLKTAMPDLAATVEGIEEKEDLLVGVLRLAGTHRNGLWGAPGTGDRFEWANPVTFRRAGDGVAVRFDGIEMPVLLGVLRQLGLVNQPDEMDQPPHHPVSIPEFLLKVLFTGQAGDKECSHLDQINVTEPATRLCAVCFADGTNWPALRMCLTCGNVGCCDTSKNKHAMQHHQETGHALMRSIRMDEGWVWCYTDNALFEKTILDRYRK